jgi:hypothetical protein
MHMPLSVARGLSLPGDAWSPRDWALAQAAKMLDWSRCPGCGQPRWLAHDPKSKWRPQRVKCESCNAIETLKDMQPEDLHHAQAYHFHSEYVD